MNVDTVFSSSESKITIDNLSGINAEITSTESHQIEFISFDSLSISAPALNFEGSYVSISVFNDANFLSNNDSVTLSAGNAFDVNARDINFLANNIDIVSAGELLLLARNTVNLQATNTELISNSDTSFSSLAGDISLYSDQSLDFEGFSFLTHAIDDITISSNGNTIFTGEDIYLTSENTLTIDSSDSISLVSSTEMVTIESHDLGVVVGTMHAVGGGQALLESNGDEFYAFGYLGTELKSSGDINIIGESDGATLISSGSGGISIASSSGSVSFTAKGSSDTSNVHTEGTDISLNVNDLFRTTSGGSNYLTGDRNIDIEAPQVEFNINRDSFIYSENKMSFSAGTSFGISADFIEIDATDPLTADNGLSLAEFHSLSVDINVGDLLSVTGNSIDFEAGNSNFIMSVGDDLTFKSDYSDGRTHEIDLEASDFIVNGGDFFIKGAGSGGNSQLNANNIDITSASDWDISATEETQTSTVRFSSTGNAVYTVASWEHNTGNHLFSFDNPQLQGESQRETAAFFFNDNGDLTTAGVSDISFKSDSNNIIAIDDFDLEIGRDYELSIQSNLHFLSNNFDVTITTSDFYASMSRLTFNAGDGSSLDQKLTFDVGNDLIVSTDRNEATNDFISFDFSGTFNINVNDLSLSANAKSDFNGNTIETEAENIILASGVVGEFLSSSDSYEFYGESDILFFGNSLWFSTKQDLDIVSGADFEIEAATHGSVIESSGVFDFNFNEFLLFNDEEHGEEILFQSMNDLNVDTTIITVSAPEHLLFHTEKGNIEFNAINDLTLSSDRNMTISTGDDFGDSFDIFADNLSINSEFLFALSVSDGPLSLTSSVGDTVFDASITDISAGGMLTMDSKLITLTGGDILLEGGDIEFESVSTNIDWTSGGDTVITSLHSNIGSEEFDNAMDGVSYTSLASSISILNNDDTISFSSLGSLSMTTESAAGQFLMDATDIIFSSNGENQDFISSTMSTMSIASINSFTMNADADFWMTAENALLYDQTTLYIGVFDDLSLIAEDASIFVTHTGTSAFGVTLLAGDISGSDVSRDNTIQMDSMMASTYTSTNGIQFSSSGYAESRRNTAGDSNAHQQFEQVVGLSARTYEPEAHIIYDARESAITANAGNNMYKQSGGTFLIDTLHEQAWSSGSVMQVESEDGEIYFNAANGIELNGNTQETYFMSYRYTDFLADRNFEINSDDDFDLVSYHSNIEINTFNNADIIVSSGNFASFDGGSELNMFAQGNMFFTAADDFEVIADRGFSLIALGDLISYTSTQAGNVIDSSEEIFIQSGGDLLLSNTGNGNENMRFEGNGVVFSSTGGDINFNVINDINFNMQTMLINAFGTSVDGRDFAQFTSTDSSFTASNKVFIDATESVKLGFDSNPTLLDITGNNGISILSAGTIEYITDNQFLSSSSHFNSHSIAQSTFTSSQTIDLTSISSDILFQTTDGSISFNVATDLTNIVVTSFEYEGGIQNTYTTGDITFDVTAGDFSAQGNDILHTITDNYSTSITTGNAFYQTTNDAGIMDFNIEDSFTLLSATTLDFSADNLISSSITNTADYDVTTATTFTLNDIFAELNFDAVEDFTLDITNEITFTSNVFTAETLDEFNIDATGDINLNAGGIISFIVHENFLNSIGASGSFTANENIRIHARDDISIESITSIDITASDTQIITHPGSEGSITLESPITSITSGITSSPLYFNANDELEFIADTANFFVDLFEAKSIAETANVEIEADDITLTLDNLFITAGDNSTSGSVHFEGATALFSATDVSILADADNIATLSNINFNFDTTSFTSDPISFSAESDTEGQQGTIEFQVDTTAMVAATSINLSSQNSGIRIFGDDSLSFTSQDNFNINTHSIGGGILFESEDITLPSFATGITLSASNVNKFISTETAQLQLEGTTSITVNTLGPPINDGVGILFRTSSTNGIIDFTTPQDMAFNSLDQINIVATDNYKLSSPLGSITSPAIEFISKRASIDQDDDDFQAHDRGILFDTDSLSILPTNDFSITGASRFSYSIDTLDVSVGNNMFLRSNGDIELDFGDNFIQTADFDISFLANKGGVQFSSPNDLVLTANSDDIIFNSGIEDAESTIIFTPGETNADFTFGANDDIDLHADNNILITAYSSADFTTSSGTMQFIATQGDILFRSITTTNAAIFDLHIISADDIHINAFERIEHRQHNRLAFFDPANQPNRPAGAPGTDNDSATQQQTGIPLYAGNARPNGCFCTPTAVGVDCANVECPDTTSRVLQMQLALLSYGLLRL